MSTPPLRKKLPVNPSLEHLQKQAKRRAKQNPTLPLASVQLQLAQEYGCKNWAELAHVVATMSRGADQLVNVKKEVEPLPKAARRRDLAEVRRILASGQYTPHDLDFALGSAMCYGPPETWPVRKEIGDLLLEHGADPDGQFGSAYGPLVFATGECIQPEGLRYLIEAGADVSFAPIKTKYGEHCPLSLILGTYGRGDNDRKHRYLDLLLQHRPYVPPEVTPAVLAIHRGQAEPLDQLLQREPELARRTFADLPYGNIALRGGTSLHCALEFDELACAEVLLKHGADLNARAEFIDGVGGQTPLFHAVASLSTESFPALEAVCRHASEPPDLSIRATFRRFDKVWPPVTAAEFAEQLAAESEPPRPETAAEKIALLHRLAAR